MDLTITPRQREQEHSVLFGLLADSGIIALMIPIAIFGGSLTLMAESIRCVMMMMIEFFAYNVMRRVHRGKLQDMEFGGGKLEQIANFVMALGMLGAAAWIAYKAFTVISGHEPVGTPLGLGLAAIIGAVNAYINFVAWRAMRHASRGETTLVMLGQLRARMVKLVSSLVVLLSMTVAALSTDNVVVTWADALGSIFVAAFIVWNAWGMLRSSIPDLVDRTAGPAVHETVNNVLVTLAGEYERLDRIRSRRSGRVVFVEVVLTFQPSLTIAEVNERIDRVKRAMQEKIEHLEVSILTTRDSGIDMLRESGGEAGALGARC
ncbi:MAG TPA: cation diffusion facilitator family transporter [Methyloceanibacter sp.]|nr:cation diffusion facilitator family transporter [Methyloceanibacter sp.]